MTQCLFINVSRLRCSFQSPEVFQFEYFVKTLPAIPKRSALLKNVCYSIWLFLAWKITDSLWVEQRWGVLCFAFWKQLKYIGAFGELSLIKIRRYYRRRADLGKRAGIRGSSATQFASLTIWPRHRHLFGKFWRAAKSCQDPYWEDCKCGGETCHKRVVDERNLLFGKIAAVGSRKYDYPLTWAHTKGLVLRLLPATSPVVWTTHFQRLINFH